MVKLFLSKSAITIQNGFGGSSELEIIIHIWKERMDLFLFDADMTAYLEHPRVNPQGNPSKRPN